VSQPPRTPQLPWPRAYLEAAGWPRTAELLARLRRLGEAGTLPGTLLLLGDAGLGREAVALELAAGLICRDAGPAGCACPSCERVRRGVHPDLEIVDVLPGKSDISIEQARQLAGSIAQRPFEGRRRVYIFTSCQSPPLSTEAASALLKTLEEPPGHTIVLLLAANRARVLPTIVSRAVEVRVPPPDDAQACALLASHHSLDADAARRLLTAAGSDVAVALHAEATELPDQVEAVRGSLRAALAGEALALLRFAGTLRDELGGPVRLPLAVATLLDLAAAEPAERAEAVLEGAAALLAAQRRQAALRLDLEGAAVGALARLVEAAARRA
jgi:hypothetical protein